MDSLLAALGPLSTMMVNREIRAIADEARISNLRMEDAVQYSTIDMEIYQEPEILYAVIPKERTIVTYQPSFFSQIGDSLVYGWLLLRDILVALSRYWTVLLLAILGYNLMVKPFQNRKKIKITS